MLGTTLTLKHATVTIPLFFTFLTYLLFLLSSIQRSYLLSTSLWKRPPSHSTTDDLLYSTSPFTQLMNTCRSLNSSTSPVPSIKLSVSYIFYFFFYFFYFYFHSLFTGNLVAKKSPYSVDAYLTLNTKYPDLPCIHPYNECPVVFNYNGTPFGDTLFLDDSCPDPLKIFFLLKLEVIAKNGNCYFVRQLFPLSISLFLFD